jgi:hypothetical protein
MPDTRPRCPICGDLSPCRATGLLHEMSAKGLRPASVAVTDPNALTNAIMNLQDPASYLKPPEGMTQVEALEQIAAEAIGKATRFRPVIPVDSKGSVGPGINVLVGMEGLDSPPTTLPNTTDFVSLLTQVLPDGTKVSQGTKVSLRVDSDLIAKEPFSNAAKFRRIEQHPYHKPPDLPFTPPPHFQRRPPHGPRPRLRRWDEFPIEDIDEAITAYKRGRLLIENNSVYLRGPVRSDRYEMDADYRCMGRDAHPNPEQMRSCTCGFYAHKTLDQAQDSYDGNCILEVELSGLILQAGRGYRAEHQRVLSVILDFDCCAGFLCKAKPTAIGVDLSDRRDEDDPVIISLCPDHYAEYNPLRRAPLSVVTASVGTEVRFIGEKK